MRAHVFKAGVLFCLILCTSLFAQPPQVNANDLQNLFKTLNAPQAAENPRLLQTDQGYVRFMGAPPGGHYSTPASAGKSLSPETNAQNFLTAHAGAFGVASSHLQYQTENVSSESDRNYVRVQQQYSGLNVFNAEAIVQLDSVGVSSVMTHIMRDPTLLDNGTVDLTPTVTPADAQTTAVAFVAQEYKVSTSQLTSTDCTLVIFDPVVVGLAGAVCLALETTVSGMDASIDPIRERVLVDAHLNQIVFHYSMICHIKNRQVYDADNQFVPLGQLVRGEGGAPSGIADADSAYDAFGYTYDFYYNVHNRDSLDGKGMAISGTVRWCEPGECPLLNAFWVGTSLLEKQEYILADHIYFGEGFPEAIDVVGHELTHGVTEYTSDLNANYQGQTGAIDESFSDIWGTYIKLTYGPPTTPDTRWLLGLNSPLGAIRDLKNPPHFGQPDRVGSPLYYYGTDDNGGVHQNDGVINKMGYLLTDGDTFNGQTVTGMGIESTAKLLYECQVHLLTSASDFLDLYMQLGQATINLGYTFDQRLNVESAGKAVEIAPQVDTTSLSVFRATPTFDAQGNPVIALNWVNPLSTAFTQVILVRNTTRFPQDPTDGMELYRGRNEAFLDSVVDSGTRYYYTLFVDLSSGFPSALNATAVAGSTQADYLTEAFSTASGTGTVNHPFDLSYSQLLFSPTGPTTAPFGSLQTYGDYAHYTVTIKKGVYDLPVASEDQNGGSYNVPMTDDGAVSIATSVPFPFFGKQYSTLYIASNGYVAFAPVSTYTDANFPSFASHFSIPRISYLFADLDPSAGGNVWVRSLPDRLVVTVVNVPEYGAVAVAPATNPNTVQLELFPSGHIRITYLGVSAQTSVVGLSDGFGAPVDPATLFMGVQSVPISSDLSMEPTQLSALTLDPVAPQQVNAGDQVSFTTHANVPNNFALPILSAQWDGPGTVPFVDNHDGTGQFLWQTRLQDTGQYDVRITAQVGVAYTFQDVTVSVGVVEPLPQALNLQLQTNNPVEDPTQSRVIDIGTPLTAEYDYFHPNALTQPLIYGEGATQVLWYMNNTYMPAYANQKTVPANAVKANQSWFFIVTPYTISGMYGFPIAGKLQMSPVVTVMALPQILNVVLPQDLPAVVDPSALPLQNIPAASGPSTGGTTVVLLGNRLSNPISVKVGGIDAQSIKAVDDHRIEVVTPAHQPSLIANGAPIPEDIIVTTGGGVGMAHGVFTFTDSGTTIAFADVNHDGKVDAVDVQLVVNAVLELSKDNAYDTDVNRDGSVNAADIQVVVNVALSK